MLTNCIAAADYVMMQS